MPARLLLRRICLAVFVSVIVGVLPAYAQLTGGTGGVGLPQASGSGQCVISTSAGVNYIAGTCGSGNLPSLGSGGTVLFQNAAGTAATWATCAGDVTCSAVTPASFTINAIRGHTVKNVLPTDAQLLIWNNTNADWEPISISGDLTITNAGVTTVASTHITGAVNNQLVTFTGTGNLANYAGTTACASQVMTSLSAAGVASCNTITSGYTDSSIAKTGGDLNTANPALVVSIHNAGAVTGGLPRYGAGGTLGNATACSDYVSATSGTAIQKALNGCLTPAVSGQDYAPATNGTSLLKGNNLGGFNNAVAKMDYAPATTGTVGTPLFNDGVGGLSNGTVSGSTTELASFSGAATPGRCLRLDMNGNASIAAGDCAAGTGFINTPTVTEVTGNGSATAIAQCTGPGCTDYNRIANGTNVGTLTLTTPVSTSLTDGEELSVEVDNDGTHQPSSISWAAGTGVTLAYGNLGATITAATCGTAAATGYEMYNWLWNASSGKLTLHDCGPVPAATTLGISLGGTGASTATLARSNLSAAQSGTNGDITSLTALSTPLPVNEGGTAATTAAAALTSLGAPPSGVDVSSSGQVTATHLASALPVAQGGTGQTTLTSGAPLFGTGTSGVTQGTLSGTGTELATFTGPATTSRCIHTNASGNLTIAAGDCTTGTAATPGFINSPTVTTGATNLGTSCSGGTCMQCAAAGCTDYERVANGANTGALTITTATLSQMTDGETLDVEVDTDGTHAPSSVAWTAGTNVTLKYANLGAGTTATACPTPSATGMELYSWQWNGSTTPGNLTLEYCSPVPAATNLSLALGGTQCSATTIGTLPVTPPSGTTCLGITNAASCTAGTAVSTTGSTPCPLSYVNGAWYPALGALSAAAAGFTTVGNGLTANGSQVALTIPVAVSSGGTNATAAGATAAHNIGAAATGVDINTSDQVTATHLAAALPVAQGGTGGTTQSATTANNIGAAAKGANADITSLSAISTPISVAQGGTGQSTLTVNAPLFGNSTSGILSGTTSGNTLQVATFNGPTTASRCLHTDMNGNVSVTSTDCTAVSAPGFVNTPAVTPSGGNSTTTWGVQCGGVGCVDFEKVANAANAGTLTMSPPVATTMVSGELFWVYVIDSGTAPSDILLGTAPTNVAYQSYVIGLLASDLTTTGATAAKKRANACGAPQANAVLIYQFWWDGANLNLTGCGETPSNAAIAIALGGTGSTVGSLNNALQIANDATTGTTADKLVSLTTANPAAAIITPAGSMSGIVGICDSSLGTCSNSGTATVINYGDHNCVFDASGATAGHYVGPSTVTAGACADVGAMPAGGLLVIGRVYGNCAASADCKINFLSTTDILNNGGVSSAVTFNTLPNAASVGTTMGKLAIISSSTMVTAGTTATAGVQGICTANCGTGAPHPTIQVAGATACTVAGSATPGDYATADALNAGDCFDSGGTFPIGGNEVVGTFLSTVSGGKATVMLWGPDVANSSGGGGGGINTGLAGQPAVYGGANTVSPIPGVFHISGTNVTDQIFKVLTATNKCLNASNVPVACDIIVDPGTTDTETGPDLVGYPNCTFGCPAHQNLIIDNAKVTFTDTTTWPMDDGLVLAGNSSLKCQGHGNGTAGITDASTSTLNSLVTTLGGVVLNDWQATHTYARGSFIYDSGSNGGLGAVWRILACSGGTATCATSGSNPLPASANTSTLWGTQVDGNVTWQNIRVSPTSGARFTNLAASQVDIEGCFITGNQSAQVNNVLRIAGPSGAFGVIRNVAAMGIGVGVGSNDNLGGDAVLIDPGQTSGFCTGSHTPLDCCLTAGSGGVGTGTCQNGSNGTQFISIQGFEPGPTAIFSASGGPAYIMRITGSTVSNISIDGGEMGDLESTNATNNLTAYLQIDHSASHISFNNYYFETGKTGSSYRVPDAILLSNAADISFTNTLIGGTGGSGGTTNVANALHIPNVPGTQNVLFRGNIGNSNTATTAIKNELSGYTLAAAIAPLLGQPVVYDYGPTGTYGYTFDGRNITFNDLLTLPPMSIAACGTCNTAAVPIGSVCYYNNAAACGFSTTAAASGAHTGLAVCNAASNWAEATCN